LLNFEIYNQNLHNCLVDSGASSNVTTLLVCKKLNATPTKSDTHIIQLDITKVKVIEELKDVMIRIASNPKFHQVIDIIVVDILEAYRMLLSWDWSEKQHGNFSIDWSHFWLPLKGNLDTIKINMEKYLKHTVSELEAPNEPSSTKFPMLGNYSYDSDFGKFQPCLSKVLFSQKSELPLQEN